jgi:hypothetical protein
MLFVRLQVVTWTARPTVTKEVVISLTVLPCAASMVRTPEEIADNKKSLHWF